MDVVIKVSYIWLLIPRGIQKYIFTNVEAFGKIHLTFWESDASVSNQADSYLCIAIAIAIELE